MSRWVRIDDAMPEHPKLDAVGPYGGWLFVCSICYCSRNLTDGFIPYGVVPRLAAVPSPRRLALLLVEQGLWEIVKGGYRVHDYLAKQQSKAQVLAELEGSRSRASAWRERQKNADSAGALSAHVRDSCGAGAELTVQDSTSSAFPLPRQAGDLCDKQQPVHDHCRGCGTNRRAQTAAAKRRGPWCGLCVEATRMFEPDIGAPYRCKCATPIRQHAEA